jgi:hypothetical protein
MERASAAFALACVAFVVAFSVRCHIPRATTLDCSKGATLSLARSQDEGLVLITDASLALGFNLAMQHSGARRRVVALVSRSARPTIMQQMRLGLLKIAGARLRWVGPPAGQASSCPTEELVAAVSEEIRGTPRALVIITFPRVSHGDGGVLLSCAEQFIGTACATPHWDNLHIMAATVDETVRDALQRKVFYGRRMGVTVADFSDQALWMLDRGSALEDVFARSRLGLFELDLRNNMERFRRRFHGRLLLVAYERRADPTLWSMQSDFGVFGETSWRFHGLTDSTGRAQAATVKQWAEAAVVAHAAERILYHGLQGNASAQWTNEEEIVSRVAEAAMKQAPLARRFREACWPFLNATIVGRIEYGRAWKESTLRWNSGRHASLVLGRAEWAVTAEAQGRVLEANGLARYHRQRVYQFFRGMDSPGHDLFGRPDLAGRVNSLQAVCDAAEWCIGFNTNGMLKAKVARPEAWIKWTDKSDAGLYVVSDDLCQVGVHTCHPLATCSMKHVGAVECTCPTGAIGNGQWCAMLDGKMRVPDWESGLRDWSATWHDATARRYTFFQGMDSSGWDEVRADQLKGNVTALARLCDAHPACAAFSSTGLLKSFVGPRTSLSRWSYKSDEGLYIADTNLCAHGEHDCVSEAGCVQTGPGEASCVGDADSTAGMDGTERHVVVFADAEHYAGVLGVLVSVSRAVYGDGEASEPRLVRRRVVVHVVLVGGIRTEEFWQGLRCVPVHQSEMIGRLELDVRELPAIEERFAGAVHGGQEQVHGNLASPANFARFQIGDLFPELETVLYLDTDVIVMRGALFDANWRALLGGATAAAVPRREGFQVSYFVTAAERVKELYRGRHEGKDGDLDARAFNAGVMLLDLQRWRRLRINDECAFWVRQNREARLWSLGTQPVLLVALLGEWKELDWRWNVDRLGWNRELDEEEMEREALIVHWNGVHKPWRSDGFYVGLWQKRGCTPLCSGRGTCRSMEAGWEPGEASCECSPGWGGFRCETATNGT